MKRLLHLSGCLIFFLITACQQPKTHKISLEIASLTPVGQVSPLLYGHFYEHIYHSANGGLWGDLVWNRSFEEFLEKPVWKSAGGILSQTEKMSDVKLIFGDSTWTDYEFTLEARRDEGYEGFLILFRALDEDNFYWLNAGGWGNSRHAIEKETGNRRTVITSETAGHIPGKEWIPVKVTVTGNRTEIYLNNQLLYNYTDTVSPFLRGAVGIGSWGTAVSFRNLKVTDLNGKVLHTGLPELPSTEKFPRHWFVSEPGDFSAEPAGALNGSWCLKSKNGPAPAEVHQDNFAAEKDEPISGSVWLKGSGEANVRIQLRTAGEVVAETVINGLKPVWMEYPVVLKSTKTSAHLGLFLTVSDGQAYIDQLSLLPESAVKNGGFRKDLYDAVAAIQPTVIRWPGGCFAELYRWKDGIGPQSKRQAFPVNIWDDKDVNSLGTDEFITLCRKLGSEPLIVINSGFHEGAGTPEAWAPWIAEACEWLEYCNGPVTSKWGAVRAVNGHPEPYQIKYWEIDNELWRSRVPDPVKYSQAVKLFAAALRKVDPSITVIAHGGNGTDREWNQVLLDQCAADFDILSIHHYSDPDGYYSAALDQDSLYQSIRRSIAACANPDIKVYVSEWNAQSTDWRTGLYAGNLLNIFEQNSDIITLGGPALFLRHVTATAWDNAFINFDQSGWFPAPNYVVMKLWRDHLAPERLELNGVPDSVIAVANWDPKDGRMVIKLVNNSFSNRDISISLPKDYSNKNITGYRVSGPALSDRNTMDHPDAIRPENQIVTLKNHRVLSDLPALSCVLIEIR